MATKQELDQKISALKSALDKVKNNKVKADIQRSIATLETELAATADSNTPPAPVPAPVDTTEFEKAILATLQAYMQSNKGTGVDSKQVRAIIGEVLANDKIKLSQLDQSILDEIKKNQIVQLSIPNFPKKLTISKSTSEIPNIYQIIDDVLAGNNVYLIGEAGGGKTYTAERVSEALQRIYVTLNCSQYTSPLEILGGQSTEGFKQGKLIDCWRNGKILILDEMPKLDPNTAGLLNDALAKSSKTRSNEEAKINSADAEEPPIMRHSDFGIIATGNIYPNEPPAPQYRGNNQQDLSLLDRFSGSVYYTEFDNNTDQNTTRFKFLYDFLVGNYYEYIAAKKAGKTPPKARGLRTIIDSLNLKNLSLVSYRTNIAFRVAFEYELVRAIAEKEGQNVQKNGKTLARTFDSYMVAFRSSSDTERSLMQALNMTIGDIDAISKKAIAEIMSGEQGWMNSLNEKVREATNPIFSRYKDFYAADTKVD